MDVDTAKQWSLYWHLPLSDKNCVHISFEGDSVNTRVVHGQNGLEDSTKIDVKKGLCIWLFSNMSFRQHHERSAQKAFAVLLMIRRNFSRNNRMDLHILYGAYGGPILEYANQADYSGSTKDLALIKRVQVAVTKMVVDLKSVDYEELLTVPERVEYRRLTHALFGPGLAKIFSTADPANTRRGRGKKIFKLKAHTGNWSL
ncbi:hypothetical protein CLF_110524 [Clonorchis sinensis]|uniref:Uncharacterized protein n=1 Tax=Clonorchis sinensis TaxID=79923 RepID=H2KUW1_CLOSI|nr:hypothetical protein CLF_110524 [Clonorchis sinensis]